jgi:hypothetical protein
MPILKLQLLTSLVGLLTGFGLGAASGSQGQSVPASSATTIEVSGEVVRVAGAIDSTSARRLTTVLGNEANPVTTIRIDSAGGESSAVMDVGRAMRKRGIKLEVERVCASLCAYYLIPAARQTTVPKGALVLFAEVPSPKMKSLVAARVGSSTNLSERDRKQAEVAARTLDDVILKQSQYFSDIGIDGSRMYSVMDVWLRVIEGVRSKEGSLARVAFVPDSAYFAKCLGLSNVTMPDFGVEDSAKLAHAGKTPIAFLISGAFYYEGQRLKGDATLCR